MSLGFRFTFISFLLVATFRLLLITFANSVDPDQACQAFSELKVFDYSCKIYLKNYLEKSRKQKLKKKKQAKNYAYVNLAL